MNAAKEIGVYDAYYDMQRLRDLLGGAAELISTDDGQDERTPEEHEIRAAQGALLSAIGIVDRAIKRHEEALYDWMQSGRANEQHRDELAGRRRKGGGR